LRWAQATYCYRRALQIQPDSASAWRFLAMAYGQRRMIEAEIDAGQQWLHFDVEVQPNQRAQFEAQRKAFVASSSAVDASQPLPAAIVGLVREGRVLSAAQRLETSGTSSFPWSFAELAAGLYLHLGRPEEARRIWQEASQCPSPALKHCRLACTYWVERDHEAALRQYLAAQEADPRLAEAAWGLALLQTQLGDASAALDACRRGLKLDLNPHQRAQLEQLQKLLDPYASSR
jgi:tetratricopeptide (TPR) repeat protein